MGFSYCSESVERCLSGLEAMERKKKMEKPGGFYLIFFRRGGWNDNLQFTISHPCVWPCGLQKRSRA